MSEYRVITTSNGFQVKVSVRDFEYLSQFSWRYDQKLRNVVRRRLSWEPKQYPVTITMGQNILRFPLKRMVMKINNDPLDMRRENLSLISYADLLRENTRKRTYKKKLDAIPHPDD